jgi:sec-independent protein translocase protein TatB
MNGTIFGIGPMEILVVAVLVLLVFGPERVPGLMRDLGRSMRKLRQYYVAFSTELKREMEPFQEDIKGIQEAAEGLREDLNAIREAADIRSIINVNDLEPAKPATAQTIAPPAVTPSTPSAEPATAIASLEPAPSPAPALADYAPLVQNNGIHVELSDDNPWAQASHAPRADKLDDDSPWAS